MVSAASMFRKSGFNDSDAAMLAKVAASYQNVADTAVSAEDAAASIVSQIRAFGKDKINYDKPFKIKLEDRYIWSIEAQSLDTRYMSYHIAIDKRNGRIVYLLVKK